MKKIHILAAEDDEDYRELIGTMLAAQPDMELRALCACGEETLEQVDRLQPDIVLMDLNLDTTEQDGAEIARWIRLRSHARVIFLTAFDTPEVVVSACRRAFASGYVLKSQASLLIPTIRATAAGPTPQSMLICASLLEPLTVAEKTVFLRMLGRRVELHSATKTIANQQTSILRKLGLDSKKDLAHVFTVYYSPEK